MCTCWNHGYTVLGIFQQPIVIEPYCNFLKTLRVSDASFLSISLCLHWKKCLWLRLYIVASNILNVIEHKHVAHYAYKFLHDRCPPEFCNLFIELSTLRKTTVTRSSTHRHLYVPNFRLEFARESFAFWGPMYWNMLDNCVKQSTSFPQFKKNLNESDMFV